MELETNIRSSAYSVSQITSYEQYVNLPPQFRSTSKPILNLEYLTALHVHQIAAVPYENLILHYSKNHEVSINPQDLFQKIVGNRRGRGGYCMENNIFFNHVLRALGFTAYLVGIKIRPRKGGVPAGNFTGWVHIANIVTWPSGERYQVDVGFGGDGPTHPLPLIHAKESINLGTQKVRLMNIPIPCNLDQSQKWWVYQYRNSEAQEWNSFYAFHEMEFTEADFRVMNFWTSTSTYEGNFQVRTLLIVRFLLGKLADGKEGIVGKLMMFNGEVKRNDGGKTRLELDCKTEEERVKAFRELFDMKLTEEEIEGVKGRNVELKGE